MQQIILHLDMDAFFAAIEQHDHPEYRGKPVIVGADPKAGKGRGVVSTCSYEARKYGIHSAMPISHAWKKCPQGIYVFPRGQRYGQVSRQIMKILNEYSPDVEQLSIDEAFLDISSTYKFYGTPRQTGEKIKAHIKAETCLTASVGIAPSKFIAKIASDLEKPDGLVIVEPDNVIDFLSPLDISRMWGVGEKTLVHMNNLGIKTIGDLASRSEKDACDLFGKSGLHFWQLARGIDKRTIGGHVAAKSISKEITFETDKDSDPELINILLYLCNELTREMRKKTYRGKCVTLKIRLADFSTFTRSRSFTDWVNSSTQIFAQVQEMFTQFDRNRQKVRLLGVSVSNLEKGESQLDLFAHEIHQRDKIDVVLDKIRERFGEKSITRASILQTDYDSDWIRD
ncbi:MAG TPA: DNA polymerase IV [bacterium]|nr:DNA polymerase IV [bacterium]HPN43657.1 DNA polymerase IV [bacterium]